MNIYDFIYFLHKQYDTFKDNPYAYNRWQDALFDYMDIARPVEMKDSESLLEK